MNKMLREFTDPSNNLFQSETWAEYQEALGHKVYRVSCDENVALLVKMPLYKEKNYLYCPRGPRCKREGWHLFLRKAKEIATKENCVFVRVEPYNFPKELAKELKFKPVGKHSPLSKQFSPMDTQLLDISKRDDDLLEEMKPKWRYNIKLAYRKGVQVRFSTKLADLRKFYELSLGLKERGYTPFELEHYERMLYILSHNKNVTLVLAESEHKLLSALLVTFFGKTATYLHGASSDESRELMPNHVAQWEAILEAKRRGCEVYDFWGVAPEGAENHSWAGITRFKKGFGGETIHFLGAFDFAFDSSWYRILHAGNIIKKLISKK